ncbi:hypothetical protein Osc1_11980 [Hominimerdicola sp. 21CYCFAH17_S]
MKVSNEKRMQHSKDIQLQKEKLQKEIENIALNYTDSPEKLAELAEFRSRFHNYSVRNTMLIYAQNPAASFIGSYARFKELGKEIAVENGEFDDKGNIPYFGVKAGQTGMKILVPAEITYICVDKVNNEWIRMSEATAQQKSAAKIGTLETKTGLTFRLGTVFDISQTAIPSKYYPQIYSMGYSSEQHAEIFEGLKAYIENELDCPIKIEIDNSITLRGFCYTSEIKGIGLNNRLEDTQRLSTLCHELGHFLMHRTKEAENKLSAQREVEADIYNIMLNSHFDIETNDIRKAHLADSYRQYTEAISETGSKANGDKNAFENLETIFSNAGRAFNESIQEIDSYVNLYVSEMKAETAEEYSIEA